MRLMNPPSSNGTLAFTVLLVFLSAGGCGRSPANLQQRIAKAEAEARTAFEQHKPEAADAAATRAEEALRQLEQAAARKGAGKWLAEGRAGAGTARNYAQLADEERQCRDRLKAWSVRAYKGVRGTLCEYALGGLAPAAERLSAGSTNSPSVLERQIAGLAWSIVELVEVAPPLSNGVPDWPKVAADLRSWSNGPPPRVGLMLALGFGLSGFTDLALCELESLDSTQLGGTNNLALYHLARGTLFAVHGWDKTAVRELDQALRLLPNGWGGSSGARTAALVQFWQAGYFWRNKNPRQAEAVLAAATRSWPESPLTAFARGEQLLARGEWSDAATALAAAADGAKPEWVSRRLGQRAREIRESKEQTTPLFSDPAFMFEVLFHTAAGPVADSASWAKLQQWVATASALARQIGKRP